MPPSTLARGHRPSVVVVGPEDGSPQIAAGLLRRSVGDRVVVSTAGTQVADPGGRSDPRRLLGLTPPSRRERLGQ